MITYPLARTPHEAQIFLDLTACVCGETRWDRASTLEELGDGTWVRRYAGSCPACGRHREYVLRVPEWPQSALDEFMFGADSHTSELVDAGQWSWVADQYARDLPDFGAADQLTGPDRERVVVRVMAALAAMNEIATFFMKADSRRDLPDSAFWTPLGRSVRATDGGRLTWSAVDVRRSRLQALLWMLRPESPQPRASAAEIAQVTALRDLQRRRRVAGAVPPEQELAFRREEAALKNQDLATRYYLSSAGDAVAAYSSLLRDVRFRHREDPARRDTKLAAVRAVFASWAQGGAMSEVPEDDLVEVPDRLAGDAPAAWDMVRSARVAAGQDPETGEFL